MEVANTPPLRKWQDWDWPTCCGVSMVHVCELSKDNLAAHADGLDPIAFISAWHLEQAPEAEEIWEGLRQRDRKTEGKDYDMDLNLFVCGRCAGKQIIWDAN